MHGLKAFKTYSMIDHVLTHDNFFAEIFFVEKCQRKRWNIILICSFMLKGLSHQVQSLERNLIGQILCIGEF